MTALHVSLVGRGDIRDEIYRQIRQAILDGRLKENDRLPSTRELARSLAVSRSTVTTAYQRLLGEGLAASQAGAATFVSARIDRSSAVRRSASGHALRPRPAWDAVAVTVASALPAEYDFRNCFPDVTLFPHVAWRRAVARALRSSSMTTAVYETPNGSEALRIAIADHVGVSRGIRAAPDDIVITNGAQQALDVIARVLLEPGDVVAVEDPGYPPPRHLFQSLGASVVGVPLDGEGLVVDELPSNARAVYVTPSHQFPLGVALSLPRRRALLAWARRHDAAIIEDDYDSEFRFGGRPLEPLQTLDSTGHVIYVGTFSKTLLPALRLGFMVLPPSLRIAAAKAKFVSDWHTSTFAQPALARFIEDGSFARHIRKMGNVYRERHEIVTAAVARDFAGHLELVPAEAGLHVAAIARSATVDDIAAIVRRAERQGVVVRPLARFAVGAKPRAGVVFGYGAIPTAKIAEGLRRLRRCFPD